MGDFGIFVTGVVVGVILAVASQKGNQPIQSEGNDKSPTKDRSSGEQTDGPVTAAEETAAN